MWIGRLKHYHHALIVPAWTFSAFVFFDLVGAFFTYRDLLVSKADQVRWHLDALPHWDWGWWVLGSAAVFLLLILENSFKLIRAVERERDATRDTLKEIALDRCLTFNNISMVAELIAGDAFVVKRLSILFENLSEKTLYYGITSLKFQIGSADIPFIMPTNNSASGYIHRNQQQSYSGNLSPPLLLPELPFDVTVDFTIEYDNVPPIGKRTTYRRVQNTFESFEPLQWRSLILSQDER